MNTMTINDITIDVIRKNIKNIRLTIYPSTGRVRMAVPLGVNEDTTRRFTISKLDWIRRHLEKYNEQEKIPPREYKQGEVHYFLGKGYILNVSETAAAAKVVLKNKKYIDLYVKPLTAFQKRHELMNEWYRDQLKALMPALLAKWEKILGVQVKDWRVKQMKTKWGSCNITKKKVAINLELIKKPAACLEYVIVHELIHLKERHHNKRFYDYLTAYLPHWKELKAELNKFT